MKQLFAILSAFILLVSHSYLTIERHLCQDEVVEFRLLLGESQWGCDMVEEASTAEGLPKSGSGEAHLFPLPCCDNHYHTLQTTEEFIQNAAQKIFHKVFASDFANSIPQSDLLPGSAPLLRTKHKPPLLLKDVRLLFQIFLL